MVSDAVHIRDLVVQFHYANIIFKLNTVIQDIHAKFHNFYRFYIIFPHWVRKLESYFRPRYPWTTDLQTHYPWSPISNIWFSLEWSHRKFFRFIYKPSALPTFLAFLVLLTLLNIVYLFFLITFLIYWLFKFLIFLYKLDIEVVQPNKLKYKLSADIAQLVEQYVHIV